MIYNTSADTRKTHRLTNEEYSKVIDHLDVLRHQEQTKYYQRCDYLQMNDQNNCPKTINDNNKMPVDEVCRRKMCLWCYQVMDFCKFHRETATLAISILDRFMSTEIGMTQIFVDRKKYQLATMTCLYIAIKANETVETCLNLNTLTALGRGLYSETDFTQMERIILTALQWRVNDPTPSAFVNDFMSLLLHHYYDHDEDDELFISNTNSVLDNIKVVARKQAEMAFSEYFFIKYSPSDIALAAVLNAMTEMDHHIPNPVQTQFFSSIIRQRPCTSDGQLFLQDRKIKDTRIRMKLLFMGSSDFDNHSVTTTTSSSNNHFGDVGKQHLKTPKFASQQECRSPVSATARVD